MGLIWVIIEIAALIIFPPLGIALILGKWIFWAIKKKILIDVWFIYLLFLGVPQVLLWWFMGVLHIIFVNFGLNIFKFSLHWIELVFDNLHEGIQVIENYSKEAASFLLFWGTIVVVFIQPPMSGNIMENIVTYGTIFGFIFVPLIVGSAVLNFIKGGKLAQAKQKAAAGMQKAAQGPQAVGNQMDNVPGPGGTAQEAKEGVHRDLDRVEAAGKTAEKAEGVLRKADGGIKWIPGNVRTAIVNLVKALPGGKAIVGGGKKTTKKMAGRKVAKKGAEKAGMAAEGLESVSLLPAILIIILVAPILWGLQAALIGGTFLGMVNVWAPMVMGPAMDAVGLGAAYGNWMGESAANSEIGVAATQGNLLPPGVSRTVSQAGAKMGCMLKGPQCLRQWRLNNTVRPGSEARGERYELQIEQFGLGVDNIDVAYKEASYPLPVNFLVSNTRNGLKGITARNVSYKISVMDSEDTYCSTGWESVSSFEGEDRDVVLPGLGVSPVESLEELNLGDCQLLQPSLGINRVMELQVKYQYSSQATLYVDAMSRQHRREQGIDPSFKKSETADTPVQSYINVQEPITYYETESGDRKVVPFAARFGFETPGFDVRYKVNPDSVQIVDSSLTTHTDTCNGLNHTEGDYYTVSENAERRINLRQKNSWFNSETSPAPLRCTMKIEQEDVDQISPTGEELVMRIDGNYTIVKEDRMTGFDVRNTLCTRFTCPMVVTQEYADDSEYDLYSKCTSGNSVDARGGCSIRVPNSSEMNWRMPNLAERNEEEVTIEQGLIARRLDAFLSDAPSQVPIDGSLRESAVSSYADSLTSSSDPVPFGVPSIDEIQQQTVRERGVIFYEEQSSPSNVKMSSLSGALCTEEVEADSDTSNIEEAMKDYMYVWGDDRSSEKPLQIVVEANSCQDTIAEYLVDSTSCTVNQGVNILDAGVQIVNPFDSLDSDQFDEKACESAMEQVRSCTGVLVEQRGRLECYGGNFQ